MKKINSPKLVSYMNDDGASCIHILQSGFKSKVLIVFEDVYELYTGQCLFLTYEEANERFNLDCEKLFVN